MSNYDPKMPWGIGNQQIQTSSLNTITESKLVAFAVGQQKKTRFQKEREEKEQKKKDEDKAAAAVYDQFVASFAVDDDEEKGIQRFVRSTVDSDKTLQKHDGKKEMDKMVEEMQVREY